MEKKMTALDKLLANKETIIANKGINRTATFYHERTGIDFTYRELSDLEREELAKSFEGISDNSKPQDKEKTEIAVYKSFRTVSFQKVVKRLEIEKLKQGSFRTVSFQKVVKPTLLSND